MRLTAAEIQQVKDSFSKYQIEGSILYLFGSRTDANKKGGDIDLLVVFASSDDLSSFKRLDFVVTLKKALGDRRIDVTLATKADIERDEFLQLAFSSAVAL